MFDKELNEDYNCVAVQRNDATALSIGAGNNMERTESLGQFEQIVLTAVYVLRGQGYTVKVRGPGQESPGRRGGTTAPPLGGGAGPDLPAFE